MRPHLLPVVCAADWSRHVPATHNCDGQSSWLEGCQNPAVYHHDAGPVGECSDCPEPHCLAFCEYHARGMGAFNGVVDWAGSISTDAVMWLMRHGDGLSVEAICELAWTTEARVLKALSRVEKGILMSSNRSYRHGYRQTGAAMGPIEGDVRVCWTCGGAGKIHMPSWRDARRNGTRP